MLVPEDRQRDGLVQTMTVGKNLSLASIAEMTRGIFTSRKREKQIVDQSIRNVHIKTDGGEAAIGSLSGGNQQKVVIGKMLATEPDVILLDEPSRGIDIGAKAEVFKLLAERRSRGWPWSTHHLGSRRMPQHRAPHHRHAPWTHLRRIRIGRVQGKRSWPPRAKPWSVIKII